MVIGAALLGLPIVVAQFLPTAEATAEPLVFTSADKQVQVAISGSDGSALQCKPTPALVGHTTNYSCDGVVVKSLVVANSRNEDTTLRRIAAAIAQPADSDHPAPSDSDIESAPLTTEGAVRKISVGGNTFFSLSGQGENGSKTLIVDVVGTDPTALKLSETIGAQLHTVKAGK